jgi:hypothetical protein
MSFPPPISQISFSFFSSSSSLVTFCVSFLTRALTKSYLQANLLIDEERTHFAKNSNSFHFFSFIYFLLETFPNFEKK